MEEKDKLEMLDMKDGDPEKKKEAVDNAVREVTGEVNREAEEAADKAAQAKKAVDDAVKEAKKEAGIDTGDTEQDGFGDTETEGDGLAAPKKKKKKKSLVTPRMVLGSLRYVAIIVCILVLIYEGYQIISSRRQHQEAREEYTDIANSYVVLNGDASGGVRDEDGEEDTETYPNLEIDFEKLREINPDLIAWLYFPALDLSYPIVKERKTDEYLTKTFAGTFNAAGAVFMDHWSSARFNGMSDFVFAHNMNDRSMFGQLPTLTIEGNEHLLDEDPYIYVYMDDTVNRYRSFAYYTCPGGGPVYSNVGADANKYEAVLSYIQENNRHPNPPQIDFSSRPGLLHLSTCTDWGDARFLVSGAKDHVWYLTEEAKQVQGKEYDDLRERFVTISGTHGPSDADASDAAAKPYPELEIDFAGLKSVNENVIGWLYMPSIDLSYPVVYESEENEYLTKTFSGEEDPVGAIFMDTMSDRSFGGWNDYVFGHFLQSGQMFGKLDVLMDEEGTRDETIIRDDPFLYVYTENRVYRYHVFAYYWAEMGDDPFIQAEKAEHLDRVFAYIRENNLFSAKPELDFDAIETKDRPPLFNLSTCADFGDKRRFIVSTFREGDWKR